MENRIGDGLWTVHFGRLRRLKLLNILLLFRRKREERRFLPLQPPSCLHNTISIPAPTAQREVRTGIKACSRSPKSMKNTPYIATAAHRASVSFLFSSRIHGMRTYRGRLSIAPKTRCSTRVRHRVDCAAYRQLAPGVHPRRPRIRPSGSFRSHPRLSMLRR